MQNAGVGHSDGEDAVATPYLWQGKTPVLGNADGEGVVVTLHALHVCGLIKPSLLVNRAVVIIFNMNNGWKL